MKNELLRERINIGSLVNTEAPDALDSYVDHCRKGELEPRDSRSWWDWWDGYAEEKGETYDSVELRAICHYCTAALCITRHQVPKRRRPAPTADQNEPRPKLGLI